MPQSPDAVDRNKPRVPPIPTSHSSLATLPFQLSNAPIPSPIAGNNDLPVEGYTPQQMAALYGTPLFGGVSRVLNSPLARTFGPSGNDVTNPLFALGPAGELAGPASEAIGAAAQGVFRNVRSLSPAKAAGSFVESMGASAPARTVARSVGQPEESAALKALRTAEDSFNTKYLKAPEGSVIDEAARIRDLNQIERLRKFATTEAGGAIPAETAATPVAQALPRYTVDTGVTRSLVKDTQTGQTLPTIYGGADHATKAAAEAARRNSLLTTAEQATATAAQVAPASNPLRKLSTAQLGALHGVSQSPQDKAAIQAILGERAFAMAPEAELAKAVNLFDRGVATNIRRSLRGVESDLTGVEGAVDAAIKEAKLELSPANRTAVLQAVMDQQASNNVRNLAVNTARAGRKGGGGGKPPAPASAAPPPVEPPVPMEVEKVLGKSGLAHEIYNSIRSLKSFIDVAIGRQGIRAIGNPVAFAKGAVAAAKGYKSGPKIVTSWLEGIKSDPLYDTIVNKMGLELTSAEGATVGGKFGREELFPGGAIERAPILGGAIQHSNAAYTHGLNVTRWEKAKGDLQVAEFLWKNLLRNKGPLPDAELAGIGRNVNVATGRGQLGSFQGVGNELGSAFFSPRNTISWPQFFTDWALHIKDGNKIAAALQAKTLVSFLGAAIGALKLHEVLSGNPTDWNSNSSDFMKVVDGDQRLDIMGGGQQWIVALSRAASGKTTDLAGKSTATTPGDVLGSFILNRTHPALGEIGGIANIGLNTAVRAGAGKPFTGTAIDPQGNEYGILETLLGATMPIIAQDFMDAVRFEMTNDNKSLGDAVKEVAPATAIQFLGFGGGRYRAGTKTPPLGGDIGSGTPEEPVIPKSPGDILLSGQNQKELNQSVDQAKQQAIKSLEASQQYQSASPEIQKTLRDSLSSNVGKAAAKAFGINLALNGKTPEESKEGALVAFNATPKSYDRGQLMTIIQNSGRLTPEVKAAIDSKRKQTDSTQPNYDLSVDDYVKGAQLVNAHAAAPAFIFGTPQEWASAARAAELLRKMIADDKRKGVAAADDPHVTELYVSSPGLATFYERDGSRKPVYISPQRKAIEANPLWSRFSDAAAEKETPKP